MSQEKREKLSWATGMKIWCHPKVVAMFFLGFSAGLPILLIFSTLSVWLREAGVSRAAVTFFSWAALGYSFKFIWAPVVDLLPVPWLTRKLGRRRSWLFLAQVGVIIAISWMGGVNPADNLENLSLMAMAAVMLGFSSATQDIAIDAYRIECAEESMQALLASMYIAGYRVGMLVAGAGSLFLASYLGTTRALYNYGAWRTTYLCMAAFMLIGIITTFSIKEPELENEVRHDYTLSEYLRFLVLFIFVVMAFVLTFFYSGPVVDQLKDFFTGLFVKEKEE